MSDEEINCLKAEAGKLLADMPKKENRAIFSTTEFEQVSTKKGVLTKKMEFGEFHNAPMYH